MHDYWWYSNNSYSSETTLNITLPSEYEIQFTTLKRNLNSGSFASIDLGEIPNRIGAGNGGSASRDAYVYEQQSSIIQSISNGYVDLNVEESHSLKYENGIFYYTLKGNTVTLTPQKIFPTQLSILRCGSNSVIKNIKIIKL